MVLDTRARFGFGVTAASAAILMLSVTSCGGGASDSSTGAAPANKDASASASPAGGQNKAMSQERLEDDARFATQPHGDLFLLHLPEGSCARSGIVPTLKVADSAVMEDIIGRLRTRGWRPTARSRWCPTTTPTEAWSSSRRTRRD